MKHTISILVENKFGVLARIAGLFSARGFNITSLAVGETEDPAVSRMTIVVKGDDKTLEQIKKQLNKLIDTIKVVDFKEGKFIDRELVLVKVPVFAENRKEVLEAIKTFEAKVANVGSKSISVEMAASQDGIKALMELLRPFGLLEVVRTGRIAMSVEDMDLKSGGKPEVNE